MATGLGALYHQDIDAGRDLAQRVFLGADQRRDGDAVLFAHLDHRFGRNAERIGDQADRMPKRCIENFQRALCVERLGLILRNFGSRQFDAVFLQEFAGEGAVFR